MTARARDYILVTFVLRWNFQQENNDFLFSLLQILGLLCNKKNGKVNEFSVFWIFFLTTNVCLELI